MYHCSPFSFQYILFIAVLQAFQLRSCT